MNILFTPPADDQILDGIKTMTARCWRQNPPVVGQHVNAQTGRSNATQFALLKVVDVRKWNGIDVNAKIFGGKYSASQIAKKEGFSDVGEFKGVYGNLNRHHWWDIMRTHYFIEFEVVHNLRGR